MLAKYNLKMPHSVFSGEDALENICGILEENQVKHLAVFTDQGIRGAGLLEAPMARVEESGVDTVILDDLPAEPTYAEAQKLVDQGMRRRFHYGRGRWQRHGYRQAGQHPDDR